MSAELRQRAAALAGDLRVYGKSVDRARKALEALAEETGWQDRGQRTRSLNALREQLERPVPQIEDLSEPLETARRIHQWVAGHLSYAGYLRDARGALYALEKRRGDCTEYMHLFIALARANGIPARGMAGYLVEKDSVVRSAAFHNWAEFYADGAWRIADAQRGSFDRGYGRYIATRILGVEGGGIPGSANRFWVVGEGVEGTMH